MADQSNIVLPLKSFKDTRLFGGCQIEEIQTMEIRDDDVWVLSFPRSGTTLTQEIVYLVVNKLDFTGAMAKPMDERFPFLDMYSPDIPQFHGLKGVAEMASPRLIKSHLHYHVLPPQLFHSNCKKIYIMRNPKDAIVSSFMLAKYFGEIDVDYCLEKYVEDWLNGKTYATPWWRHVRDFWLHRTDSNLLVLMYEDLVKDLPFAVRQIAGHLGAELSDDDVTKIAQHCKFENMKHNRSVNAEWQLESRSVNRQYGGHIRKGKIGGWRDYFSKELSSCIDRIVEENITDLDLHFDYGD